MNNQEKFEKVFAVTVEVKANENGTGTEINLPTQWWNTEFKKESKNFMKTINDAGKGNKE